MGNRASKKTEQVYKIDALSLFDFDRPHELEIIFKKYVFTAVIPNKKKLFSTVFKRLYSQKQKKVFKHFLL